MFISMSKDMVTMAEISQTVPDAQGKSYVILEFSYL